MAGTVAKEGFCLGTSDGHTGWRLSVVCEPLVYLKAGGRAPAQRGHPPRACSVVIPQAAGASGVRNRQKWRSVVCERWKGYTSAVPVMTASQACSLTLNLSASIAAVVTLISLPGGSAVTAAAISKNTPTKSLSVLCSAELQCQVPLIAHGRLRPVHNFTSGGAAMVECDAGYVPAGTGTVRCLSSGRWQPRVPACVPGTCGFLFSLIHLLCVVL